MQDVVHANSWVQEKELLQSLVLGQSTGTGFASYHASLGHTEKLVLVSPFATLSSSAQAEYAIYPVALMLKTDLDNITNASFAEEGLILHGTEDKVAPIRHARTLFEALPQKQKKMVTVEGYGHNDIWNAPEVWS